MTLPRFLRALGLALVLAPGIALAQPADKGGATSAPLFVDDLPVGSVSVRVARPSMTQAVPGASVVGTWIAPGGERSSTTVKTGDDGRATFTAVPVGSTFQVTAHVEGEDLASAEFAIPAEGGTRLLMMVGANAAEAMNQMTGGAAAADSKAPEQRPIALRAGVVQARDGLPAGTVDLRVLDVDGSALASVKVSLGHVENGDVKFVEATTDGSGRVHFANLKTGAGIEYAAVIEHGGFRLGSDAFTLDDKRGAAGEIRVPARSSDLSILHISSSSRLMIELREDAIAVLQNLIVENTSDKIFDPGKAGLFIPLADGFVGAEKLPGGSDVEIKEGVGVFLHGLLPPSQPLGTVAQVRIGYVLATHEQRDFEIVQPMPLGIEGGLLLVPNEYRIGLAAQGLRARPSQRDEAGNQLRTFDLDAVPPGHALRLTVHGLPTHDAVGKWIAGALVALIILAGIVAAGRSRGPAPALDKAG